VFKYCGAHTAERPPKAAVWTVVLVQTPCIDPSWIKKSIMTLLCQWLIMARQCSSLKVTVKLIKKCTGRVLSQYVMEWQWRGWEF